MKLLKIDNNRGYYHKKGEGFSPIDKISKEDLLSLLDFTLDEDEVEYDEYNEETIKNQAHQVIYKSVFRKLKSLRERRQEFVDESARLYLEDYEKYREDET